MNDSPKSSTNEWKANELTNVYTFMALTEQSLSFLKKDLEKIDQKLTKLKEEVATNLANFNTQCLYVKLSIALLTAAIFGKGFVWAYEILTKIHP